MRRSCAVWFLAVALCLVVCVSATGKVTRVEAEGEVTEAKGFVKTVRARAQTQLNNATSVLGKVDSSNSKSAQALSQAEPAATDYLKAKEIADHIKSLSAAVAASYSGAKGKLETAVSTLSRLLEEAKQLDEGPAIVIKSNTDTEDDFTETKQKGSDLKTKATDVDNKITEALREMNELYSTANEMEQKAKEAQMKSSHVSVIVSVSKIETMLRNADTTIEKIEGKKNAVSGIVEEMKTLKTKYPTVSDENIKALLRNADNALTAAKGAVQHAKDARTAIQTQKDSADAALTKVKEDNKEVSDAQNEASTAEVCVGAAEQILPKLNDALQTATNSVTSATNSQKKLKTALSTTTTEQNTQPRKEKEESNLPVADGTDSQHEDATIQPPSKESLNEGENSADKHKDTLINGAQNVSTTALTGEKAPAPGAKNDSAMTVSVPLLVALIASAVLQ